MDNNWKITGVDLSMDDPRRAELVEYINLGLLEAPYDKSYNLSDYDALVAQAKANNVVVNGKASFADALEAVAAMQGGIAPTFRLRDLAYILKGTEMAFNVEWNDAAAQVVVTKGGEYTAEALPAAAGGEVSYTTITVLVDGQPVEIQASLRGGNYYVTAEGVSALLGVEAAEVNGVLMVGEIPERASH